MKSIGDGDLTFAIDDHGAGDVIVFLHGFPLNRSMWGAQLEEFCSTHRVIAPDLRGHGGSSVTEGVVTMSEMADDVARVLDALHVDSPITLCGLSMGGYVAWEFWRRHRERLANLVLCDTRAVGDSEKMARARQIMGAQVIAGGASLAAESMIPKLFAAKSYDHRPDVVESVREMIMATAPNGINATQCGIAQRMDMSPHLSEVATRTLVLCGSDDRISPVEEMSEIAKKMPNAEFVEIPDAGHMAPLEQPAAVNAAMRAFLA